MAELPQDTTWVKVQQKTFTRWCNTFLCKRGLAVTNLATDLKDGLLLINLLEIISDQTIKHNKKPRMNVQMLENLTFALEFLQKEGIQLVSIDASVIFDGNLKLILGLIWTIILRYQLQIEQAKGARQELLDWVRSKIPEYNINNFTNNWSNGKAICALAEAVLPGQMKLPADFSSNPLTNASMGMTKAKDNMNIPMILDPEDMVHNPEELSMMTYISYFRDFLDEESRRRDAELAERTPYPPNCRAYGRGLEPGNEAGNETDFTIEAVNRFGRKVPVGGHTWDLGILGPKGSTIPTSVVDNGNGTYTVRYTPNDPGKHVVNVAFKNQPIKGSPFHVDIGTSQPDPTKSKCYGPGLKGGEAHKPAKFTIESYNKAGNRINNGGHPYSVLVTNPYGEPSDVDIIDNNDGTYSVTYLPTDPGTHNVTVSLNKQHVDQSPYKVPIGENMDLASPTHSYADGPGLKPGNKNNKPAEFTIYSIGPDGKPKKNPQNLFDVIIEDPNNNLVQPEIKDNGDGTYKVKYQPTIPGPYNVDVILRNPSKPVYFDHVKNSPIQVNIAPSASDQSTAYGPGLEPGNTDTQETHFFIQPRDITGAPLNSSDDEFNVDIKGPTKPIKAKLEHLPDGKIKVTYKPEDPGPHEIMVTLDNKPIKDAPFHVVIQAGSSAKHTTIEDLKFVVKVRDRHNKQMPQGGEDVKVSIKGPKGPIEVALHDNNNGTYQAHYNLAGTGKYSIPVTLNGENIKGSPLTQTLS